MAFTKEVHVSAAFLELWKELDADDERETMRKEEVYGGVADEVKSHAKEKKRFKRSPREPKIESDYDGPHLSPHFQLPEVLNMMDKFSDGKMLHYSYASHLVEDVHHILEQLPTVVHITVPKEGRLIVCGDTHGQFNDVRTIFRMSGMPSATNMFLFNGDFVDRGPNGAEVMLTLYALKKLYPAYLHLNRGNHESRHLNERYGFEKEILAKYDGDLFDAIEASFTCLPLVHVIENQIVVMHGGLSAEKNVTLEEINSIDRIHATKKKRSEMKRLDIVAEALVWSDPRDIAGTHESSRGAGCEFGADITHKFLTHNNLKLLIRSHEMMDEGYRYQHNNELITIFSASFYCGKNDNFGAFINIAHHPTEPTVLLTTFETYKANIQDISHLLASQSATTHVAYPEYSMSREAESLQKIRERVYENRHSLLEWFAEVDTEKQGAVRPEVWGRGMTHCLNLPHIDWITLLPYFSRQHPDGSVPYVQFCQRYQVPLSEGFMQRWRQQSIRRICERIAVRREGLQKTFELMDADHDGTVTYSEFCNHMRTLNLGMTDDQLFDIARGFSGDQKGRGFDYFSFLKAFETEFMDVESTLSGVRSLTTKPKKKEESEDSNKAFDVQGALGDLRLLVQLHFNDFKDFFRVYRDSLGAPAISELLKRCTKLDHDARYAVARTLSVQAGSEMLSWDQFTKVLGVTGDARRDWREQILQAACTTIYAARVQLRRAFRFFDQNGDGVVSPSEFAQALTALNVVNQHPLDSEHLQELYGSLDVNGDGMVNFEEFLAAFRVKDTDEESVPPLPA